MARRICTTDRDALRAWVPAGYSPARHVGGMAALGLLAIAALLWTHGPEIAAGDLAAIPIVALVGTMVEYVAHRYVMHGRLRWLAYAWEAHIGRHHHFYRADAPTWERASEIWLILFSPADVAVLAAILALPAAALRACVPPGAWAVALSTMIAHFLAYEAVHLACHLPDGHPLLRAPALRALRRRHLRHHELSDMHANFGVTTRLWDRVLGTERR